MGPRLLMCSPTSIHLSYSKGEVKVSDFGISAELQNSVAMCGTFVGTFKYMSPERIRNQPYNYASVSIYRGVSAGRGEEAYLTSSFMSLLSWPYRTFGALV